MMQAGANSRTLGSLAPEVINALQGRTDVTALVPLYLKRALQEITVSTTFEELAQSGPTVALTANQNLYPVTYFLNDACTDYSSPRSFAIYVDFPANTVKGLVKYKTPKGIEQMTSAVTQGIPAWFTRYGQNFIFGPTPNQGYSVFLRYQIRYPFPEDQADVTALNGTPLLIPDDWEEIVVYSAAQRIAVAKRWNEQAKELHDILYGDPEFQMSGGKRGRPGLMSARLLQMERDEQFDTRQLTPMVPRYNRR